MSRTLFHAFTAKYNGIIREIITDAGVSIPFVEGDKQPSPGILRTRALWDTGATNCVVTKQTAAKLNLKPSSLSDVYHAGGRTRANVYLVNIYLPNNVVVPNVRVTECEDIQDSFGIIIGMNVIAMGDFSVTNLEGRSVFSFRIPSVETIDYVEEANRIKKNQFKHVGRNDPCPCGSGLKYKKCCGKE